MHYEIYLKRQEAKEAKQRAAKIVRLRQRVESHFSCPDCQPMRWEGNYPVLRAYLVSFDREDLPKEQCEEYWVSCIYCRKFHYHGAGDGERIAHCYVSNSPYKEGSGYYLELAGPMTSELKKRHRGWQRGWNNSDCDFIKSLTADEMCALFHHHVDTAA